MKVIVQFSGGKDSQAALIQACKQFGSDRVTAVFCDTGWEHEVTYRHIKYVVDKLGCKLITLRNENVDGMIGLCKHMKWFPDYQKRMCTLYLKIYPMIDYILKEQNEDMMIIQGIRAGESDKRSKMPCSERYFYEYYDKGIKKKLYRKRDVLKWCEEHAAYVERPLFGWTAQDVIDYILDNDQEPNPLYKRSCSRVGCYPCIFSRMGELKVFAKDTQYVERLAALEDDVNALREIDAPASFFPKGKIPERFCKTYGNGIPSIRDVVAYVQKDDGPMLFDEFDKQDSCMSLYHGLCE